MAASEMNQALEATLSILQRFGRDLGFLDLAHHVIAEARVDEATAKASILRLNSAGEVEIALDWSVHLSPVEAKGETQAEAKVGTRAESQGKAA